MNFAAEPLPDYNNESAALHGYGYGYGLDSSFSPQCSAIPHPQSHT